MSEPLAIIDAGPLLAALCRDDADHTWATGTARELPAPMLTSEAVLTETCFLLRRNRATLDPLFEMLESGTIRVAFDLQNEHLAVASLIQRYASLPMSLADATLVRLAELHDAASIFTLDHHFTLYRKHGRQTIPLIVPPRQSG